jgi:mono/diheme cytochrome c family protein
MRRAQPMFVLAAVFFVWTGSNAQSPNLGMPIEEQDIAAWDIDILPDGTGLPSGQGTAEQGEIIYAQKCAVCHGVNGEGGISPALAGGEPLSNGIDTGKTIGNFWPYATTIFDYTRRAMPWFAPRTLTDDEVYALTAYLLVLNNIIDNEHVMNAGTLPAVQMPNRDGFIVRFPERTP